MKLRYISSIILYVLYHGFLHVYNGILTGPRGHSTWVILEELRGSTSVQTRLDLLSGGHLRGVLATMATATGSTPTHAFKQVGRRRL